MLNTKMTQKYQKNFGKSKSTMEHQKLLGKLSEYVILTIQGIIQTKMKVSIQF